MRQRLFAFILMLAVAACAILVLPHGDVLTGFLSAEGEAYGRPVGVALDRQGALLVADDVGNIIWRVTALARH